MQFDCEHAGDVVAGDIVELDDLGAKWRLARVNAVTDSTVTVTLNTDDSEKPADIIPDVHQLRVINRYDDTNYCQEQIIVEDRQFTIHTRDSNVPVPNVGDENALKPIAHPINQPWEVWVGVKRYRVPE